VRKPGQIRAAIRARRQYAVIERRVTAMERIDARPEQKVLPHHMAAMCERLAAHNLALALLLDASSLARLVVRDGTAGHFIECGFRWLDRAQSYREKTR
jgi:hypothetical protein